FLRDFTLVDAPGYEATAATSAILARYLPRADLIFFTLALRGEAAVWDFLASLPREHLRRLVLIVSKCDTVAPHEVLLGVKRLRHTMLARLGQACPIFAVAAPTRSGFDKLERHIDSQALTSTARCERLRKVCDVAQEILRELGEPIQVARKKAEREAVRIDEHRQALGARNDQSLRHAAGTLWSIAQTFEAAKKRGEDLLRGKLTLFGLLRAEPAWWAEFHREIEERLRHDVLRHLDASVEHFTADLQDAWEGQRTILRRLEAPLLAPFSRDHAPLLSTLRTAVVERDPAGATTTRMGEATARARDLLRFPGLASLGALAGLSGAWLAGTFVEGAALILVLTTVAVIVLLQVLRSNAFATFRTIMAHRRELLLGHIEDEMRGEMDRVYEELAAAFEPLIAAQTAIRTQFDPVLQRLEQLGELFEKCRADIAARKASAPPPPEELAAAEDFADEPQPALAASL
ncbi:MAG TPA: hypothetical protein VGO90_13765, partial [Chthoniobacteraceae bacterium]|nr:hypothetical protein [Chthoniobacteraceae bacterium]